MRLHLFELEDQPWFPKVFRDGITDFLQYAVVVGHLYRPVSKKLQARLEGHNEVVDLCSGGGGPWEAKISYLDRDDLKITLTDRYPNISTFQSLAERYENKISYSADSVCAMDVPDHLEGFRTMFSSFHHFRPEEGGKIIQNAIDDKKGIAIMESTQRHILLILYMLLTPVLVMVAMLFIRPVKPGNLFWTFIIPVIPLAVMFDGIVSCLRTYTPQELEAMVKGLNNHETYDWEFGVETIGPLPVGVTYLIGTPKTQ